MSLSRDINPCHDEQNGLSSENVASNKFIIGGFRSSYHRAFTSFADTYSRDDMEAAKKERGHR